MNVLQYFRPNKIKLPPETPYEIKALDQDGPQLTLTCPEVIQIASRENDRDENDAKIDFIFDIAALPSG